MSRAGHIVDPPVILVGDVVDVGEVFVPRVDEVRAGYCRPSDTTQ